MLERLIKKPVLKEEIDQALPEEVIVSDSQAVLDTGTSEQISLAGNIQDEIEEYDTLIDRIEANVPPAEVDPEETGGISLITPTILSAALSTGNPAYSDYATAWTSAHYRDTGNIEAIALPIIRQIRNELLHTLNFVELVPKEDDSNKASNTEENKLSTELLDLAKSETKKASEYRKKLERIFQDSKKKLEICMAQNLLLWVTSKNPGAGIPKANSIVNNSQKLEDIRKTITSLRAVLKLYIISRIGKIEDLTRRLTNRLEDLATRQLLYELYKHFGMLESKLVAPFADMLDELFDLSNENYCGAFDEFIRLIEDELYGVRSKYLNVLYEHENGLTKKYLARENLMDFAVSRVTVEKQLVLLDKILELLEVVSSTGELDERTIEWAKEQVKYTKTHTKPGPEKGGNP